MITLSGRTYTVPPPTGMRSFALQQRILPVASRIASVFAHLLGVAGAGKLLDADIASVLPSALPHLGAVFADMPAGELEAITRELLRDTTVDKMPLFGSPGGDLFDAYMRGHTLDVWMLLWHALEVWYPDFFTHARSLLARQSQEKPSSESSTSATPGQSVGLS